MRPSHRVDLLSKFVEQTGMADLAWSPIFFQSQGEVDKIKIDCSGLNILNSESPQYKCFR